ncbi:MAG: hypothetical protein P4L73_07575 [Caulobacteraceae bacterium]|nr:hypothetical protein [Caulobacteraceae bacterium]
MSDAEQTYAELLDRAREDPQILAFWLDGSRGKGRAGPQSDYDCTLIVADDALAAYRETFARLGRPDIQCQVMTLAGFEAYAAWGSESAWARYNYAQLRALIDKTGQVQALIEAKARVPDEAAAGFIEGSIDHWINQAYRSLKCFRDGLPLAARLEAAEGVTPLLNALFALHGGRLKPYAKYLEWELAAHPLEHLPWTPEVFLRRLTDVLDTGDIAAQRDLIQGLAPVFRAAGHRAALDSWDEAWPWLLDAVSGRQPPGEAA